MVSENEPLEQAETSSSEEDFETADFDELCDGLESTN
jgi:hypothetical protein